jgi:hypothetical protein
MTIGTRVTKETGVVATRDTTGFSVQQDGSNAGIYPFKVDGVLAVTASLSMSNAHAGVMTLSGSTTGITGTMPTAASVGGAWFTVRNANASLGHQLTASLETAGAKPFTDGFTKGAKLTINAGADGAVVFHSDGANFLILGGTSGSFGTVAPGAGSLFTISS